MHNSKFKIVLVLILANLALGAIFLFFIPAFRGNITPNPVINLGVISIRWYGLILALAILLAYLVARRNSWRFGIDKSEVDELAFWLILVGLISARIYYVIFDWPFFAKHPSEIYKIWHGGLSIFGALLGGVAFIWFFSRKKAYSKLQLLDLVALALPLGQALGRFGNFFNQEAYGYATDLPWRMHVSSTKQYHHPVFLYEAIASILIFFLLNKLAGRLKNGSLGLLYLILYSLSRFFIEPLRVDSVFIQGFRADQVVAFMVIVFASVMLFRINRAVEK
ncbi:MAG: prolipoprotein diacylglyceryl transferase [Candidatus Doudnabacteria bacterium]|nr:prolipoprotein diacylglyceryl transferase [Candidatus Doudnabacteria bacterium]